MVRTTFLTLQKGGFYLFYCTKKAYKHGVKLQNLHNTCYRHKGGTLFILFFIIFLELVGGIFLKEKH